MGTITAVILCVTLLMPVGPGDEDESEYPEPPVFATGAWIDYAAHIVASEARNVPAADIVIACTLLRDVERGWHPWNLRRRWFGYGTPDAKDVAAVRNAVYTRACEAVPEYKFVGNLKDVYLWRSIGLIGSGPLHLYVGLEGSTVIGVPW